MIIQPDPKLNLFLEALFPSLTEEFIEVRAFPNQPTIQRFYPGSDALLSRWNEIKLLAESLNVYIGVCARSSREGNKNAIRVVRCLWADLDAKDFDDEMQGALTATNKCPVPPSFVIASGHGFHVYWILAQAEHITSPSDVPRIEAYLKGLATTINGDPTAAELARILRLPGTFNRKDPGKVVSVTVIECHPDRKYLLQDFDRFLIQTTAQVTPINPVTKALGWIAKALDGLAEGNRHASFVKIIGRLHHNRWTPQDILTLLLPHAARTGYSKTDLTCDVEDVCHRYANPKRTNQNLGQASGAPQISPDSGKQDKTIQHCLHDDKSEWTKEVIRDIATDGEIVDFDKRREIAGVITDALNAKGDFCRTADGRVFLFERTEKRLYDLEQRVFQQLFTDTSGLSATENYFKFSLDVLISGVARHSPMAEVITLAACDVNRGQLWISNGGNGVWVLDNGTWHLIDNGQDGRIFLTEPECQNWTPDFSGDGSALSWFLDQFNFVSGHQTADDQKAVLKVWLISIFFRSIIHTRPIPAFLGPQGSGKTTCCRMIGRLLQGRRFNVTGLRNDKEDAFVAAITNRVIFAIDNADSHVKWLEDALARYATGETFRLRRLYSTNEEVSFEPRATLMLTSRDPHFRRPDVAERLLPFNLRRFKEFQDEESLFRELEAKRSLIVGDLLRRAQIAMEAMKSIPAPKLGFRMADFASFAWRIYKHLGQAKELEDILGRLEKAQAEFVSEGESLIEILREALAAGLQGPISTGELFLKCGQIAAARSLPFPKTSQGFGKRFWDNERVIELELCVKIIRQRGHAGKIHISFQKNPDLSSPL